MKTFSAPFRISVLPLLIILIFLFFFSNASAIEDTYIKIIQPQSGTTFPVSADIIPIDIEVSDPDGIVQVSLNDNPLAIFVTNPPTSYSLQVAVLLHGGRNEFIFTYQDGAGNTGERYLILNRAQPTATPTPTPTPTRTAPPTPDRDIPQSKVERIVPEEITSGMEFDVTINVDLKKFSKTLLLVENIPLGVTFLGSSVGLYQYDEDARVLIMIAYEKFGIPDQLISYSLRAPEESGVYSLNGEWVAAEEESMLSGDQELIIKYVPRAELKLGKLPLTIPPGISLNVSVMDDEEQPVEGASVFINDTLECVTDSLGICSVLFVDVGNVTLKAESGMAIPAIAIINVLKSGESPSDPAVSPAPSPEVQPTPIQTSAPSAEPTPEATIAPKPTRTPIPTVIETSSPTPDPTPALRLSISGIPKDITVGDIVTIYVEDNLNNNVEDAAVYLNGLYLGLTDRTGAFSITFDESKEYSVEVKKDDYIPVYISLEVDEKQRFSMSLPIIIGGAVIGALVILSLVIYIKREVNKFKKERIRSRIKKL